MCASYFYFIEKPDFSKLSLLSFSSSEQFKKDFFRNNYYIHFIFLYFYWRQYLKIPDHHSSIQTHAAVLHNFGFVQWYNTQLPAEYNTK